MITHHNPTPTERAAFADEWAGASGLISGWEEHVVAQELANGLRVVDLTTTRPCTLVDLMRSERQILMVRIAGDSITVRLPGDEYKPGGIMSALRRHSGMSEEARRAAGERLRAARGGAA